MAVIDLESMPLGFRFHPTDVELVNHYLKRKIDGRIKSDGVAVIPEVDVCRCEPWDLPSRSVIRSADPEWFFFSPRDRKYPNGSRHNRATEAGYWKATGKDRLIKSPCGLIGMKKTLVFYRGRAPRAERTHWIMHEYRTTEPEFESGKQGGFVLCRLFKKTEENQDPNTDEIEGSGFSPTLTRSLPSETQHGADAFEESAMPLDKKSSEINSQRDSQTLPATADNQPEASHSNSIMASNECDHEAEVVGTEVGPYPDDLSQFLGSNSEQLGSIEFPYISSPLRLTDFQFDEFFNQGPFLEQHDSINELSDAFIIDEECDFTKVLNNMACLRSQYNLSSSMEGSTGNGIETKAQNPQYSSSSNFGAQQGSAIRRLRMKGLVRRKKHNRVIKVPALEKLKQVIKEREGERVHFPDNDATGINPNLLDHESKRKLGSRRRDIGTEILHLETTRTGSPRVINRVFVAVILAIPLLTCLMALMVKLVTSR